MPTIASLIFDLILLIVVLIAVLIGKNRGFLITVYMLCVVVIAIFLGNVCMPFVSGGIEKMHWGEKIEESVYDSMMDVVDNNPEVDLDDLSEKLHLPKSVVDSIEDNINEVKTSTGEQLVTKISSFVAKTAIKVISYVLVAVVVIVILLIILLILKAVKELPVLGTLDSIGGGILGGITGIAIIMIICAILYAYGLSHNEGALADISGNSYFIKAFDYVGLFKFIVK